MNDPLDFVNDVNFETKLNSTTLKLLLPRSHIVDTKSQN